MLYGKGGYVSIDVSGLVLRVGLWSGKRHFKGIETMLEQARNTGKPVYLDNVTFDDGAGTVYRTGVPVFVGNSLEFDNALTVLMYWNEVTTYYIINDTFYNSPPEAEVKATTKKTTTKKKG